jgi:molybdate transport system substrate-binding protein
MNRFAGAFVSFVVGIALVGALATGALAEKKTTLNVFAAASLLEAFNRIASDFEQQNPDVKVRIQFAGSQTLAAQIEHGAEADVFASADDRWMDYLAKRNFLESKPRTFAGNHLVLVVPKSNPGRVDRVQDIARPGVRVIVGSTMVPVGDYTRQVLSNLSGDPAYGDDFGSRVVRNVVSQEENVKSIVNKVVLGEADAGFVYRSDVTHNTARHATMLELPPSARVVARYPIAVLKGHRTGLGNKFVDYVLSPAGQEALKREFFLPAP